MSGRIEVEQREDEALFSVRVQPRASRLRICGVHDGALKVQLTAPPVQDRANLQLLDFLASQLRVPKASMRLVSGSRGRRKKVAVKGLDEPSLRSLLKAYVL